MISVPALKLRHLLNIHLTKVARVLSVAHLELCRLVYKISLFALFRLEDPAFVHNFAG